MSLDGVRFDGNPEDVFVARDELLELVRRPAWHADALCKEYPHLSWFVSRGESMTEQKAVCRRCAVMRECRAAALERGEKFGVWGALSERERRRFGRVVSVTAREAA